MCNPTESKFIEILFRFDKEVLENLLNSKHCGGLVWSEVHVVIPECDRSRMIHGCACFRVVGVVY